MKPQAILDDIRKNGNLFIEIIQEVFTDFTINIIMSMEIIVKLSIYNNEVCISKTIIDKSELANTKHELIREAYEICIAGMEQFR